MERASKKMRRASGVTACAQNSSSSSTGQVGGKKRKKTGNWFLLGGQGSGSSRRGGGRRLPVEWISLWCSMLVLTLWMKGKNTAYYHVPTRPFTISGSQDQEIGELYVRRILKLRSCERVGRGTKERNEKKVTILTSDQNLGVYSSRSFFPNRSLF